MTARHFYFGIVFAMITAIGLGSVTTQAKIFYAHGGDGLSLMFFRFVCSSIVLGGWMLWRRQSFKLPRDYRLNIILLGLIWSGSMICYLKSVELISVSLAVLVLYIYPLVVLGYSLIWGGQRFSKIIVGVFITAFAGLVLLLMTGRVEINLLGVLFALGGTAGAAYTFIKGAEVAPRVEPLLISVWVNILGIALILPLIRGDIHFPINSSSAWALAGATFCYIVAIACQFFALSRLSAAVAAFVLNLEPVVSILLALLFLGETLALSQWLGVVMILGVVFLAIGLLLKSDGEASR